MDQLQAGRHIEQDGQASIDHWQASRHGGGGQASRHGGGGGAGRQASTVITDQVASKQAGDMLI